MKKIVVIDDEPAICLTFEHLLRDEGFSVRSADNGKTGMEIIRNYKPDLVITDLMMPEQDGHDTIRQIRNEFPDIAIIAMSAMDPSEMSHSMEDGANCFISKPVDINTLLKLIRSLSFAA